MVNQEEIFTLDEAAAYLKVHSETIRLQLCDGKLKGTKIGGVWRIRKIDIDELFVKQKAETPSG